MLQTYLCVRLRCTICGGLLIDVGDEGGCAHHPTPEAALNALRRLGGGVGRGGCVSCPDCGPTRLQTGLCVGVRCAGCTQMLTTPTGSPAHHPRAATAAIAAQQAGWRATRRGAWFCPMCSPVLTCRAHGHEFTPWHLVRLTPTEDPQDEREVRHGGLGAAPRLRAYRTCQRCSAHQSHHDYRTRQARGRGRVPAGGGVMGQRIWVHLRAVPGRTGWRA